MRTSRYYEKKGKRRAVGQGQDPEEYEYLSMRKKKEPLKKAEKEQVGGDPKITKPQKPSV